MNTTFLDACNLKETPYRPIWLMRQAGRYLESYQQTKKKARDFVGLCTTPALAAEVTLQPVDQLGVDAAILFSDILVVVEALGLHYEVHPGSGPIIHASTSPAWKSLQHLDVTDRLHYVFETIHLVHRELAGRVPLLGFSAMPFTLATYIIEGGTSRDFRKTKQLMYQQRNEFYTLLQLITEVVIEYAKKQIESGVEALQLFDTWASVLSRQDYYHYVQPHSQRVCRELRSLGRPLIHYINGVQHLFDNVVSLGTQVISLDWRCDLAWARDRVAGSRALQGNLDPHALYLPDHLLEHRVREMLEVYSNAPGYIVNLGHGVFPQADPSKVKLLVDLVHELSR